MLRFWSGAVLRLVAVMLMASFAGAMLMRIAPGFSSDDQELNSGLSAQSLEAIRRARLSDANVPRFYAQYLAALMRGDLGTSRSLNQPVKDLLRERLPITLVNLAFALAVGWLLGLALAISAQVWNVRALSVLANGLSGTFISTPAAALALIFLLLRWPPAFAAALLVFPKIYRYIQNLLQQSSEMPHVLTARAKGAGPWRVLAWHLAPIALPQLIALVGVSISIGIGVLLPIEVVSDVAGIGQLAWHAAQARDLPLLVNLTIVVTFVTVCATLISDAAQRGLTRSAA
ncbi:MAG: binding-protein-dependent transport system inner rane component [Candidatus Angelobacter sp.]|nr:binding-protein-dependent transport system inner rane component [Candidatus Angelobacter sp.]